MTSPQFRRARAGLKSGFTLIEVLIALALLGTGILSLAGSVTIVTRLVDGGGAATRAAFVALARIEAVRGVLAAGTTCPGPGTSGGPTQATGVTESWAASAGPSSLTVVVEVVRWNGRRQSTDTLGTVVPC